MILDEIRHWHRYAALSESLAIGLEFLANLPPDLAPGRREVSREAVHAIVNEYTTRPDRELRFESHDRHVDIQSVLKGEEELLWSPRRDLVALEPYAVERDITFYAMPPDSQRVRLLPGLFAVFFPDDAHAPGGCMEAPGDVRKIVVKAKVIGSSAESCG